MSSVLDSAGGIQRFALRLNVDQYHKLCDSGIVPERTELLSGIVVAKMGKSPLHTWAVEFLSDWIRPYISAGQTLRVEQPLSLKNSEPEPDLAVVSGSRDDYRTAHPKTASLVIEVAISTVEVDREKATIYASSGIDEYWLVLPQQNQVVVHRSPDQDSGTFAEIATCDVADSVSWNGHPLSCSELFPK